MSTSELAWVVLGFSALPIAVFVIGLVLLVRRSRSKQWTRYAFSVAVAVIAWGVLTFVRSSIAPPEGSDDEEVLLAFFYFTWPALSLAAIVLGGSFWFLIGHAAAVERESLLGNSVHIQAHH